MAVFGGGWLSQNADYVWRQLRSPKGTWVELGCNELSSIWSGGRDGTSKSFNARGGLLRHHLDRFGGRG